MSEWIGTIVATVVPLLVGLNLLRLQRKHARRRWAVEQERKAEHAARMDRLYGLK